MLGFISEWKNKIAHYIEVRVQLFKLNMLERTSSILSYFIFAFISLFISVCILIFLGIGLGEYLSTVFDSRPAGYFATSGIYILMMIILFAFRKAITNAFAGVFIRMMTATDEDEDDEDEKKASS